MNFSAVLRRDLAERAYVARYAKYLGRNRSRPGEQLTEPDSLLGRLNRCAPGGQPDHGAVASPTFTSAHTQVHLPHKVDRKPSEYTTIAR